MAMECQKENEGRTLVITDQTNFDTVEANFDEVNGQYDLVKFSNLNSMMHLWNKFIKRI